MAKHVFDIGADGIDSEKIIREIRAAVTEKMRSGTYSDSVRETIAKRTNLDELKNEENFLLHYLDCLREAVFVDINDFQIHERRSRFPGLFVLLKRVIWKLLKFYTYRLWSQQNQTNGLLLSAIEGVESRYRTRIEELEERIRELESRK
ncbi:MAG: hypothetical protein R6V03_07605 [Kiritimatiellia bacterium]